MSGKKLTDDQMEKLNVRGGQIIVVTVKPGLPIHVDVKPHDPCEEYCNDHCGSKSTSASAQASGQDYYQ